MARPRTTEPTKPSDARAQRSIEALCSALLKLIEHKSIDDILIREITDVAGVSNPTFFRRFSSKEELLEYIATEEVHGLLEIFSNAMRTQAGNSGRVLCDYIQSRRNLWKTLLTRGAASAMREEFMKVAEQIAGSGPRANPWLPLDLAVPFTTSGIFEILAWWMRQPDDYPEENVITLFDALIVENVGRSRKIRLLE